MAFTSNTLDAFLDVSPVGLGSIEKRALLSLDSKAARSPLWVYVLSAVPYLWIALLMSVLFAWAPLLVYLMVSLQRTPNGNAFSLFILAIVACVPVASFVHASKTSGDSAGFLGFVTPTLGLVASAVGLVLTYDSVSSMKLAPLGLVALVCAGSLCFGLFASRSSSHTLRYPPLRGPKRASHQAQWRNNRETELNKALHKVGVELDESTRIRLREMPLGYWAELDSVDTQTRASILEQRATGWRVFTPSDRLSTSEFLHTV